MLAPEEPALAITVLVLLILVVVFTIIAVVFSIARKVTRTRADAALSGTPKLKTDNGANFFGLESKGMGQIRGNGTLTLTPDTLHFFMAVPANHFEIPLARIQEISHPNSHCGKGCIVPLLKITFTTEQGSTDSIAFALRNSKGWAGEILRAKAGV